MAHPDQADQAAFFECRDAFVRSGIPHDVYLLHMANAQRLRAQAWRAALRRLTRALGRWLQFHSRRQFGT